jgi:hypothetical protein
MDLTMAIGMEQLQVVQAVIATIYTPDPVVDLPLFFLLQVLSAATTASSLFLGLPATAGIRLPGLTGYGRPRPVAGRGPRGSITTWSNPPIPRNCSRCWRLTEAAQGRAPPGTASRRVGPNEDGDDGDHHQQLDQREGIARSTRHGKPPPPEENRIEKRVRDDAYAAIHYE